MQNLTAKELTDRYNALTGKAVKPTSYPKAKLIEMIEALEVKEEAPATSSIEKACGYTHCPHCGIDLENGYAHHDDLVEQHGEGCLNKQWMCLGCCEEFGPELESTFTMVEAAKAAGVEPKIARARYRALYNDGVRSRYVFPRSQWDHVIATISPKRKAK